MDELKTCSTCGKEQPISNFYTTKQNKGTLCLGKIYKAHSCKSCYSIDHKKYYYANKGRFSHRIKQYKINHLEQTMWLGARKRAKNKGIPFNIEASDVVVPEYCPVLNMRLVRDNCKMQDNSPTLDRIIPELGYVKGNVMVISWRANKAKGSASAEELQKIIEYINKSLSKET
jgi:hypothetical protein